eukprot:12445830-Alexandrium_andersonii.AAC.1
MRPEPACDTDRDRELAAEPSKDGEAPPRHLLGSTQDVKRRETMTSARTAHVNRAGTRPVGSASFCTLNPMVTTKQAG